MSFVCFPGWQVACIGTSGSCSRRCRPAAVAARRFSRTRLWRRRRGVLRKARAERRGSETAEAARGRTMTRPTTAMTKAKMPRRTRNLTNTTCGVSIAPARAGTRSTTRPSSTRTPTKPCSATCTPRTVRRLSCAALRSSTSNSIASRCNRRTCHCGMREVSYRTRPRSHVACKVF